VEEAAWEEIKTATKKTLDNCVTNPGRIPIGGRIGEIGLSDSYCSFDLLDIL